MSAVERRSTRPDGFATPTVPAVSVARIANGKPVDVEPRGVRSARDRTPIDERTVFQAASLSKTLNALAVLALHRDGVLDLDVPVDDRLHRWSVPGPRPSRVTPRRLLAHGAGLGVHGFDGYPEGAALPDPVEILAGTGPCNSPAVSRVDSTGFRYSGGGVTVLQVLVEDVTDAPYADVVHRVVFAPLGMRDSYAVPTPPVNHAAGHGPRGGVIRGGYRRHPETAAAGIWTTPSDMARALVALLTSLSGARDAWLPRELAMAMVTRTAGEAGLGTFVDRAGRVISHDGANHGYRCAYRLDLIAGTGRVVMTNGCDGDAVVRRALRAAG